MGAFTDSWKPEDFDDAKEAEDRLFDLMINPPYYGNPLTFDISDPVTLKIIKRLEDRHKQGIKEYGQSMSDNPGDMVYWLDNLIEELLDGAQYAQRLRDEITNGMEQHTQSELPFPVR